MAITYDAHTISSSTAPGDPFTFSHTVAVGASLLIVMFAWRNASTSISAVTYGGVAMTPAVADLDSGSAQDNNNCAIYYLTSPASGSATVSIDLNAAGQTISAMAVSFAGTLTTASAINATNSASAANASGTEPTVTVTSTVANCWLMEVLAARVAAGGTITQGAESGRADWPTTDWEYEPGGNEQNAGGTHYQDQAAGAYAFSWTTSEDRGWAIAGVAIAPAVAAAGAKQLAALGVG